MLPSLVRSVAASLFAFAILLIGTCANGQDLVLPTGIDPECVHFIREVCVPQWKMAEEVQRNFEVDCEESYSSTWVENAQRESRQHVVKWTYSWDADLRQSVASCVFVSGIGSPGTRTDCVYNPQYRFSVRKGETTDRFTLSDAIRRKPEAEWRLSEEGFNRECLQTIACGRSPFGLSLIDLVEHPDFELVKAGFPRSPSSEPATEGPSQQSIYIEARCATSRRPSHNQDAIYQVTLRAENQWLVSHAELHQRQEPDEKRLEIEYSDRKYGGMAFPRKITSVLRRAHVDNESKWVYVVDDPKRSERKSDEFLVSAYGLPENVIPPLPGTAARTAKPIVLINLGIAGILLSIWLGRLAFRMRRNSSGSPGGQEASVPTV